MAVLVSCYMISVNYNFLIHGSSLVVSSASCLYEGRQGGSRSRERNYTLVDPVCINKELVPSNLNLPKGIRPSRSSNFTPGASAVTSSSGKVTFSGAEKNPHLGKTGCRVTEAHYINNDGTRQFLSDSNSVLPGRYLSLVLAYSSRKIYNLKLVSVASKFNIGSVKGVWLNRKCHSKRGEIRAL